MQTLLICLLGVPAISISLKKELASIAAPADTIKVVFVNEMKMKTPAQLGGAYTATFTADRTFQMQNGGGGDQNHIKQGTPLFTTASTTGLWGDVVPSLMCNIYGGHGPGQNQPCMSQEAHQARAGWWIGANIVHSQYQWGTASQYVGAETKAAVFVRDTLTSLNGGANGLVKGKFEGFGSSSAFGDPHVTNILGEKFDILKSGPRVMIKYPREGSETSLLVVAHVVRADSKWCENTFIEEVNARGSMLGTSVSFTMGKLRSPRPFQVTVGSKTLSLLDVVKAQVPLPTPASFISGGDKTMTLKVEGLSIRVQLVTHSHFQFLNLDVSGLTSLAGEVGGLLGLDDHTEEAHDNCKWKTRKAKLEENDHFTDVSSLIRVD